MYTRQVIRIVLGYAAILLIFAPVSPAWCLAAPPEWKAGLSKAVITPQHPVWMAGYAARNKPSEGTLQELYAKVLALEDARGGRLVLVTTDLIGFPRALAEPIAERAGAQWGLRREQIVLNSSHTHTGPVLRQSLVGTYDLDAIQAQAIERYSQWLADKTVALIGEALKDLSPARLHFGHGTAGFGVNRREPTATGYRIGVNPKGPVDPDVPVLRVTSADGRLRGIIFGYACHNTTLTGEFYQFSGDYAGYAQAALERSHPGALALFVTGCGADINPHPRSRLELAEQHGAALAQSVDKALGGRLAPVRGRLRSALDRVTLPFAPPPTRQQFEARRSDANASRRRHAERMLARLEKDGRLVSDYSYTVQVAQFGKDLTLIALAGEVVVDYALRLQRELGAQRLWVAGYCNDVFAYIPSARVLKEGGYEADQSMVAYDLPGPWDPAVEELIIGKVRELLGVKKPKSHRP